MISFSQEYKMKYNITVFTWLICLNWNNIENINFKFAKNLKEARKQMYWYSDREIKAQTAS